MFPPAPLVRKFIFRLDLCGVRLVYEQCAALFQAGMTQGGSTIVDLVQYYNTSQNWVFLGLAGGIFGGLSSYVLLKGKFSQ